MVAASDPARASTLERAPRRVAERGAEHLAFGKLFASPFGAADVSAYVPALPAAPPDGEALWLSPPAWWVGAGAVAAAGLVMHGVAFERWATAGGQSGQERAARNELINALNIGAVASYVAAAVAAAVGVALFLWPEEEEK